MLKKLRNKKTAKKIWIVLTILILPAFVFWGFGSFIRSKQETAYAGKIFGRNVSALEYKDAFDAVRNQAIIQFGDNFPEVAKGLNLELLVWDRLLLLAEAKKRRIKVSDQDVVELIQSYPFFQRKGQFDNQVYSTMLQYVFHTQARIFEEQTRQSLILSKLYNAIAGNITLSEDEIRKEYQKLNEQISLYYIAGLPAEFAKEVAPSQEEIRDYFTKNSFSFRVPLSFNIEYLSLALEDKSEKAVNEMIKALIQRLSKGDDFGKTAKDFNLEVKETGFFNETGPIPGIGWSLQFLTLISKLKTGQVSPPIYADKHYYILRLKERKEPYIPDLEAIKDKVKEGFIKDTSRKIARQKIDSCLAELTAEKKASPKTIDFARSAKTCGLKSDSTASFGYGSYIEGIGSSDNFFTAAQALGEDGFSGIIEVPSGFYIIKLKSKTPIDEKKFLDEKPAFAKKFLLQKKEEYFSRFLDDLRKRALSASGN